MKASLLILAALALIPVAAYAHDDAHRGMMPGMMHGTTHGKSEGGHSGDGGHAQGVGEPGDPNKVSRTIQVLMSDNMKFTPAKVNVKRGESIKFVVRNVGNIKHEMVIGSMSELKQHVKTMRKMPGMEHDEPNMVTLDPGKSEELVWQFTKAGTIDFACLQPGHFEAGMMGKVSVK
jgi:uncharacterized cupredoxin-like copper-binding protein